MDLLQINYQSNSRICLRTNYIFRIPIFFILASISKPQNLPIKQQDGLSRMFFLPSSLATHHHMNRTVEVSWLFFTCIVPGFVISQPQQHALRKKTLLLSLTALCFLP
jgi:hypothetical protein